MAIAVDYGVTDPEIGRFGLYNDFFVRISRTGSTIYKLKYRIKVSIPNTSIELIKDVNPINEVSIVNPVSSLKDLFFKTQLVGTNGVAIVPLDSGGGGVADRSYNKVRIQIGEFYATTADGAPTFVGYGSDKTLYFYNGFETDINQNNYSNWRPDNLYDRAPFKLPLVNKNNYLLPTDIFFPSIPSEINTPVQEEGGGGVADLVSLEYTHYDKDGNTISSGNFGLGGRYGSNLGYWTIALGREQIFYPSNWAYSTFYAIWEDQDRVQYLSETFNTRIAECDPKYDRFRLRWFNKYSGFEYFNFTKKSKHTINVNSGKEIRSNGVDYTSTNFAGIKYPSVPELREVGKSATTVYELNSNWINEEEQAALKDMYLSPNIIMFDKNNRIYPVILKDKSYEITDIRDGMVKVSVKLMIANENKLIKQ